MAVTRIKSKKYGYTYQADIRYEENGHKKRHIKSGFRTEKDAKKYVKNFNAHLEANKLLNSSNLKTFNEVFLEYMKMEGNNKYAYSTIQNHTNTFNKYIKDALGKNYLNAIDYRILQNEINRLSTFLTSKGVKRIKDIYSVVYKYAIRNNYVKDTPVRFIKLPKGAYQRNAKEVEVISDENLQKIIDEMQNISKYDPKGKEASMFTAKSMVVGLYIGRYTGVRIGEALGLRKEDFDLEKCTMRIQRKIDYQGIKKGYVVNGRMKTKTSKATVEIPRHLADMLKQWFEVNPYDYVLCDSDGNFLNMGTYQARIKDVSDELGIDFHYHMLRHTYASELVMNNVNPLIVQKLVRHASVSTTIDTYSHAQNSDQRELMDMLYGS